MALNLITNRTAKDVSEAQEILLKIKSGQELTDEETEVFFNGLRGCYNATDINRVTTAMQYLANSLKINIGELQELNNTDIFTNSDWAKYLSAIKFLRNYITLPSSVPQAPTTLFVTKAYERANDIEKILVELEYYITLMIEAYYYSGEIYAGEV